LHLPGGIHDSRTEETIMAETDFQRPGSSAGQSGHPSVTGSATLQPGTFHGPDASQSGFGSGTIGNVAEKAGEVASAVGAKAEDAWEYMTSCMSRHPLAVFFTAMGLGALIAMAFSTSGRWGSADWSSRWGSPEGSNRWEA
jgi:hypothetical protein